MMATFLLACVMAVSLAVPSAAFADDSETTVNPKTTVDSDTTNSWQNFTAPGGVTSTQNVGRIWTDKSVFDADYALSGSDTLNGKSISKGDSDFLVGLSALSSTSNLKEMVKSGKPLDIVLVLDMSGSMGENFGYGGNSQKKITALKTAVNSFIDATASANDELDASQRHEISIVKFAGTKNNKVGDDTYNSGFWTYNYSQVVTNLRSYTSQDANQLKRTVNNLEPAGGTQANYGMELAQSQLQSHGRDDAQQVVIFFTDGEPGDGNSFSTSVANGAVKAAQSLKDGGNGALIYTVGIFNGASSTNMNSQANQFMQAVSSNYPNASAYNNRGTRAEGDYYKTASDASELNSIFEDIFQETQEGTASGSPIVDESEEGNTEPGDLNFTDQLGSYMQVSGDKMTLVFADGVYEGTINDDGTVTFPDEMTTANTVYGSAKISDIKVTINKSSDLATGDTVNVTIPASLLPMRNYDVDTDTKSMSVTDAYPVRLFYGASLKADAKAALSNPASDTYQAIVASQATDSTIDFYSNSFVKEQADGETTASFEPNAGNKFYYYTQDATLYVDESCRTEATSQNIGDHNTLYWKDTYWVQTANGGAEERSVGVAIQRGSAEWNAMVKEDGWNGAYYIPAGTQRSDRPATLTSQKSENKTDTATNVLNPSWNDNGTVTQALGNNGKLSFAKPGSLEIKKTVDWGNASDDTKTNHNSFSFDITASTGEGDDAKSVTGKYNYFVNGSQDPSGTVEFKDGKGTVTMNGGDTLVIEGLPAGASFTVTEQNANSSGFSTTDATSQADVENTDPKDGSITGTIIAGSQVFLTFTNTYHASDVNLNTNTTLKVQKNLTGRDWRDSDSFDFTIDGFYAPTGVSEAPEPENTTVTVDAADKDASYTASFGDITFSAPGEYRYTVQEVSDPEQPIAGIDYSDAIYRVTVMIGDNGTGALTIDSVKIERMNNDGGTVANTSDEGVTVQGDTMMFTNTYKADSAAQGIQGKKSYNDTTGGNPFEAGKFTFKLEAQGGFVTNDGSAEDLTINAADTPMPADAENNAITTGNVGPNFTFPSITFDGNDVGNTYVYKVTEQQGTEQGMTYSKAEHTVMIQVEEVTDDDGTHIKATVLGDYSDPSKLVFENEYKPTEAKLEGSDAIHGTKTLTGREMQDGETYYFQLSQSTGPETVLTQPETVEVTKENMKDGIAGFTFANMSFTKVGTYTFTVNEVADENGTETTNGSGMTYDTNIATVEVVVSDAKDGSLKADVSYSNDKHGETTDQALFTNVYEASMNYGAQGKGGINVTKTMKGRPMTADEFSFSIAGTNVEGSVSADEANKKLTDADRNFQNVAAGEGTTSSMAKLQNVSFDQDDAGKTFSYLVDETTEENAETLPGVVCDKSQYRVDIQVVDNGDGTMHTVTTVTQIKDANGADVSNVVINQANSDADGYTAPTFGFTNDYNPNPATVGEKADYKIQVKKTVTGADSATDYTFTLTATGDNIGNITGLGENNQLTVSTDGTITAGESQTKTFDDLTFSEPGTYTFTVQENQPDADDGWTFDTTARTVTVVVTDLNKEGKYDGNLYIASVTDDGLVEITNSYNAEPVIVGGDDADRQIMVQKSVTGKNPDGDFKFKIEPVDSGDAKWQNVEAASDDFDAQTTVSDVTTEQSQTATFAGIKFKATGEYKFKITEVEAHDGVNDPAGWTYDAHESFATVKVTDNGEGQLEATVAYDNSQATTDADKAVNNAAAFTNSYTPDETTTTDDTNVKTNILVTKQVTGAPATEAFTFQLKLAEGQSNANVYEGMGDDKTPFDGVEVSTPDNLAAGATETKAFAGVTFTAPGDYKFVIDETTTTDKAGWTYDSSTHEITVHVVDQDAKLVITGIDDNNPTFTNSYTPNEVTTDGQHGLDNLRVTKEVTGAPATEDFSFSLKLKSGDINNVKLGSGETETAFPGDGISASTTGLTDKEGDAAKQTVSFGDMSFTATGTYTFEVVETTTTDKDGWHYDNTVRTITVEVTDDGFDGQLDAKVTGDSQTITNNYTAGSVTVGEDEASGPIQVTKNIEGTAPATEDFNFELAFDAKAEGNTGNAENIEGLTDGKLTATVSKDSLADNTETVSFGDLTFKAEGEYYFTVTETTKAAENSGWTYDNTAKTVIVSVTDTDHDGHLEATVNDDAATATNSYKADSVTTGTEGTIGNLQVTKEVKGNSTNAAFSFTATLTSDNAANVLTDASNPESTFPTDGITASTEAGFTDGQTKAATFGNLTFATEGDYTFKVVENGTAPANWTYATGEDNAKTITIHVTDTDHDGKLEAAYDETNGNNPTFTNSYKAEGELPGTSDTEADLEVTKTIDGRSFQDGDAFAFTLTADEKNPAGATLPDNAGNLQIAYAEGDDTATKSANFGNIKFTLPGTYTFYVSEQTPADADKLGGMTYSTERYTVTVEVTDAADGKLDARITSIKNAAGDDATKTGMAFTNTYQPGGTADLPTEGTGSIQLQKVLTGKAWDSDEFTFQIAAGTATAPDGSAIDTVPMPAQTEVTVSQKTGTNDERHDYADFTFGPITYDKAGTYTYTVAEVPGTNAGMDYDDHSATVTVTVSDNKQGGFTAAATVQNGTFTNNYASSLDFGAEGQGGLWIHKSLTNHNIADGQFEFTITAADQASADKAGFADGLTKVVKPTAGKVEETEDGQQVAMSAAEIFSDATFAQDDADDTYTYTVQETKGGADGYVNDDTVYTVTITTTDDGQGGIKVSTRVTGTNGFDKTYVYDNDDTTQDEQAVIPFDNSYDATGELGGNGATSINATKTLTNRPMVDGEFTFNVTDAQGNQVTTGTNDANGNVTFGAISYEKAQLLADAESGLASYQLVDGKDTFTYDYTVAEDQASFDEGVTAIAGSFQIKVTVTDNNDGTLSISVAYPEGGNGLQFRNAYGEGETGQATLNVNGTKSLKVNSGNNAPDIDGKYTFTLAGSEGAPLPEKTSVANDAAGNVNFGDIQFTMENVFGNAGAAESTDDAATVDENADAQPVEGTETEGAEADATTGATDEPATADAGVDTQSAQRTKTFTYTVTESGSVPGVVNDPTTVKTFTITVTDNGDGTLSVAADPASGALFSFTNTYSVTPVPETPTGDDGATGTGHITITKALEGRTLAEGEFSFVMTDAQGTTVSEGANDASGNVELSAITFSEPGDYTYTLAEKNDGKGGVAYDRATYQVTAHVTDNGDGTLSVAWQVTDASQQPVDAVTFTNTYEAAPASVTFGGAKVLDGRELAAGEFTFQLADKDGKVLDTTVNAADGSIAFDTIPFTEAGTYEYTISEVLPTDDDPATEGVQKDGVTYDEAVHSVSVVVSDDGLGCLQIDRVTYDGGQAAPVFTNVYAPNTEPKPLPGPVSADGDGASLAQMSDTLPFAVLATAAAALVAVAVSATHLLRRRR